MKNYIEFRQGNLFAGPPYKHFDIIFCRNVMIYFERKDQEILVNMFYDSLISPGYLFIGHSESLHMLNTKFTYKRMGPASLYYKDERSY